MLTELKSTRSTGGSHHRLHLTISNVGGSVEHYHHFLLGFLVPLVLHRRSTWQNPSYEEVCVRSCGPMDAIIRQLNAVSLAIVDKAEHERLGRACPALAKYMP